MPLFGVPNETTEITQKEYFWKVWIQLPLATPKNEIRTCNLRGLSESHKRWTNELFSTAQFDGVNKLVPFALYSFSPIYLAHSFSNHRYLNSLTCILRTNTSRKKSLLKAQLRKKLTFVLWRKQFSGIILNQLHYQLMRFRRIYHEAVFE